MGCYGIGVGRCLAAIAEQHNDENGLIWPKEVAPFDVIIVPVNSKDENLMNLANTMYEELRAKGIDVLLDDRDERPGVKFKDADLIGIPKRIVIGKKAADGIVEFKLRNEENVSEIKIEEVIEKVTL